MTWYLSGPMSGIEDYNFPAFEHAATVLRARGLTVLSPHENGADPNNTWADFIRMDLKTLANCDGIVLLRGWTKSQGAQLELGLALKLGFQVRIFNEKTLELMDVV